MIHVRRLQEIDRQRHDDYVAAHSRATPYHLTAWGAAVERAYGHPCWIITAEQDGQLAGILPVCKVAAPFSRGTLVSLPFCDLGGPLADDTQVEHELISAGMRLSEELTTHTLELRVPGDPVADTVHAEDPEDRKVVLLCDLPSDSEQMLGCFKPKLRSQIRKAEKNGISVELSRSQEAVNEFYLVFAENMQRLGSPVHSAGWFSCLADEYGASMIIGIARFEGRVVGGAILLTNGTRATVPWASTAAEYNRLAPNMLLYWSLIAWACDHGYRCFDFGRSTLGEGTYRFKRQWGAVPHELQWTTYANGGKADGRPVGSASRLRTVAEGMWQHLPLSVANQIGPWIRKYITL